MLYAEFYFDNLVKIHNNLPLSWKNISGLNNLSDLELSDLSWSGQTGYKFIKCINEDTPNYDQNTEKVIGPFTKIENNTYVFYWDVVPLNQEEIQERISSKWTEIRDQRNQLLNMTDWTQLTDVPFTVQQKEDWKIYRQALRDITEQIDPFNIIWPTEPAA
jgi:uncharacterized protein YjiS (DUF1127 family)